MGFFQARVLEWGAIAFSGIDLGIQKKTNFVTSFFLSSLSLALSLSHPCSSFYTLVRQEIDEPWAGTFSLWPDTPKLR